jgi:post-segregation antitoxin (ccd killing protein)
MDSSYPKKTEKEDNKIPIEIVQDDQALAAEFEKMTDAEDSAYLGDEVKLGDAFKETSIDSYQVTDRSNKRLAEKVPALEKEIAKLKNQKNDGDGDGKEKKKGLINSIGKAFESISTKLENNIETMLDDPGKRALFYAGTDMVDKASRITPISSGKAQSPFGMVVSGFGTGVKRVKQEELAKAKAEATKNKGNLKNQLDLLKLNFEMDQPDKLELRSYDNLDKMFKDIESAVSAGPTYNQQKKLVAEFAADKNNKELPVGKIRSKIPLILQSINELIPLEFRQEKSFFDAILTDANFLNSSNKLTNVNVLTALTNTKLVPVSDKDLEVVKTTKVSISDPAQTYLTNLIYQDAINTINAETIAFKNDFIESRGSKRGSKRDFNTELNSVGALNTRNKILEESKYDKEQIYEEAKALGFVQDYEKYGNEIVDFSPFALASAKASLDMGGKASYGRFIYSDANKGTGANIDVDGTGQATDGESWKDLYPNIKDLSEKNKEN